MTNTDTRQALHAYLDPEAHAGWQQVADDSGVSVTALMNVIGLGFAALITEGIDPDEIWPALVKTGRKVDATRRRRGDRGEPPAVDLRRFVGTLRLVGLAGPGAELAQRAALLAHPSPGSWGDVSGEVPA